MAHLMVNMPYVKIQSITLNKNESNQHQIIIFTIIIIIIIIIITGTTHTKYEFSKEIQI